MQVGRSIPTFMVVVDGNEASEFYASAVLPSWTNEGFNVRRFNAITPEWMPNGVIKFTANYSKKYTSLDFAKEFTPTEKAVWWSHYLLWKKCIELNCPIMVLEHDSYLFQPYNLVHRDVDFVTYDHGAMGCYIIRPALAEYLIEKVSTFGVQSGPLGFILDHALRHFDLIWAGNKRYLCACNQVYSPKYATTIDHYSGTQAEQHMDKMGTFDYLFVSEQGIVDVTRRIVV